MNENECREKLITQLIHAEGQKEYYRVKYNNAFICDGDYLALFKMWSKKVETIMFLLENYYYIN